MAMGTGAKVAIGCGCIVLLTAVVVLGLIGAGAWWAKDKVSEMAGGVETVSKRAEEISAWEEKANANPYVPPADGVIAEPRLLKFLDTRKQVYSVYETYQADLRDLQRKAETSGDKLSPSELWSAGGKLAEVFGAIRLAQMKALAEAGMNEQEYRDIQLAVYKSAWASETEKHSGKLPAEAVSESIGAAAEHVEQAVQSGLEMAQTEKLPGAEQVRKEDAAKIGEVMTELGQDAGDALSVPKANLELFRKHEADIKKYAMHGLAFIGL